MRGFEWYKIDLSTIDIDNAYAYREKGFLRSTAAYIRSLIKFEMRDFSPVYSCCRKLRGIRHNRHSEVAMWTALRLRSGQASSALALQMTVALEPARRPPQS